MVYFKEVLPNPVGQDTDGEWIKLINTGDEPINLTGWSIEDASGKKYTFNTSIDAKTELVLEYSATGITLNNNNETLTLFNGSGEVVDTLTYSGASDDEIIVASQFIETTKEDGTNISTLEEIAITGETKIISGDGFSVVIAAIAIALILSFAVGLYIKKSEE